jgi:hypothetical protein
MNEAREKGPLAGACCGVASEDQPGGGAGPLSGRQRWARAWAGLGFLGLASALGAVAAASWAILWLFSAVAAWFGLSHLAAAATGYAGCPELGAIPSLLLRRHVSTRCVPWENIDRRMEPRA